MALAPEKPPEQAEQVEQREGEAEKPAPPVALRSLPKLAKPEALQSLPNDYFVVPSCFTAKSSP